MSFQKQKWWKCDKGQVWTQLLTHVQAVEQSQFDIFNRFVQLAALYDPNNAVMQDGSRPAEGGYITENVVATNVDTVSAIISAIDLRARVMTDGGNWTEQGMARRQELYAEGLEKIFDVQAKAEIAFKAGPGIRGTGLMYVGEDRDKGEGMAVEVVLADDIIVDERECRNGGTPRQMHRRKLVDRDELAARYPKHKDAIAKAQRDTIGTAWQTWAGYRPLEENEVIVLHSHRLPVGVKGQPGYVPGRETVVIDGADLFDAPWEDDYFPYAKIVWSERDYGWYGIGLAERIMGHQQVMNRSNYQIDRLVNLNAIPTTYVSYADHGKLSMAVQRPGVIVALKGSPPVTPTPPAISPEVYKRVADVKHSASEESGVNRMLSQGVKPAGLDSGAALRELNNATTQRFATQEKAYERFRRDIVLLMFACCKKLGNKAPVVKRSTRFGVQKIQWSKVDLRTVKTQIQMASGLPRTVAGRTQMVLEWAQAGLIDQDESRRLLRYPDIERSLSLFTSGVEALEHAFDAIREGEVVMPEPFMPLKACVKRGMMQYLDWWRIPNVPEEVLENLRTFIVQAVEMDKMAANENAAADPMAPPMPGAAPEGPPQAALSGQAMQLKAV